MNIEVITAPPVEPVTVAEALFQLKLTADPEADVSAEPQFAEVSRCIASARAQCEQITRRAFVQQTLLMTRRPMLPGQRRGLQWYMNGGGENWGQIELLRPPLIEVSAVRYYDDSNVLQEVDEDDYYAQAGLVPKLAFAATFSAPSTYIREDAIQIEYIAGYAPVVVTPAIEADPLADPPVEAADAVLDYRENVPASIKQAILLGVQLEFDKLTPAEREAIERARDSLLSSYRIHSF